MAVRRGTRRRRVDLSDLRVAGGVMLVAAALGPLLPVHPGVLCPLRRLTGVPCPLCGMTTSVTAAVHLHVGVALAANPAGVAAVVVALALLLRPRWLEVNLPPWAPSALLGAMWLFELRRFGIF